MYSDAKYLSFIEGMISCIEVKRGDITLYVPLDPANTDYANIMALVTEGKLIIAPAEGAE